MVDDLLELWRVHDEINLFLLQNIPDAGFEAVTLLKTGQPSNGRTVARIFVHMHGVRRSHLTREFLAGVPDFETGTSPNRAELIAAFQACGRAMTGRLRKLAETGDRAKHRPGIVLLGYLVAHDSQHRGQILLALKQSGVKTPDALRFDIWEHWMRPKLPLTTETQ